MYKDLSLKEKAKVLLYGGKLGLTSVEDIAKLYDDAVEEHLKLGNTSSSYISNGYNPEYEGAQIYADNRNWWERNIASPVNTYFNNISQRAPEFVSALLMFTPVGLVTDLANGNTESAMSNIGAFNIGKDPELVKQLLRKYNEDKFVNYLERKTGKIIKRVPIKDSKIGDVYSEGFSYVDDKGKEIAHIAGNKSRGNNVFVESSYISPEFRNQGIGKQMYFDFNQNVYNNFGTTLHSSPYQHQATVEVEPGSGVFISPSSKLWRGLKLKGMAEIGGLGLDKYFIMSEPLKLKPMIEYKKGGPIVSPYGLWKYPGRDTIIPSNNITMDNVNYPVLGVSDTGDTKVMMPWNDYKFRGSMVYEHPLQEGGNTKPTFDLWYPTVPKQKNDTSSYDLRRAYNMLPFDEMEKFRTINDYHLPSVAYDEKTDTYTFLKRNGHPTLNYELDWYNSGSPDVLEFRKKYKLDTLSLPWRYVPNYAKGGSIHIDPKNKGKLTETMRRTGKSKYELAHSKNPLTRKRALFAINASHWKHLDGGYSDRLNNLNWKMHHSAGSGNIGSVWYNYTFDPENNYYNGTHYVGQNLLGKTQEQLPLGRDHINLYTYGDETGFERINNAAPITVNGETYDYRQYYGNILPFDTIYLKPESLPVVDSMIKHKNILGINTDYFIMDLNDAKTYPKQYKNVFSHRNIKKGMPLDDTRAVSVSPKKDENGYYLDAFDVIDYKKTTGFAGNRLDKIVERENILNGPYILRQKIPVVFDKNKESNGPLLNLISQYKDNGMTWEEYLIKYSPSYNKTYGRHNQDAANIEHKRSKGGHLFLENGYLQEAPKTFVAKQYDINLPLDWNAESWLGERADNYKGPKYTDEDIKIFESHVPEYRLIEENARNNGTWLKMSDGTTWNGDPRDWVLMQSKAFKNNYKDKVWYTGLAEWPTTVNYNGQDIQTDKVKRARYHNGLMWFSDNPGYALYFADYVDLKGLNSREWQYNPNGGYEKAPYINGMVFTAVIPKNSEIHSLLAPKEGTHDLWQKMPYVLTETGIERIPEYKLHQNKKGRNLINDDILNNKLITDDLVNHAENLGWKGLYMFNVDDGPVFINKPGENYIPQESLHLEGVDTSRGTINEFISLPGLTEKLKFIHGNNGDFNPNIEDKYSYLTKDNYGNLIKFGGKIKK